MKMPLKKRVPRNTSNNTASTSNEIPISAEAAQQFEIELCWCIQQLQTGLRLGKLNPKQIQDHTKALNTLMSNSAPLVKKRQVMRLAFGDYRAKMAEEDKKVSVNTKIKVAKVTPSAKSVFVRRSNYAPSGDNSFKFNFPNASEDIVTIKPASYDDSKKLNADIFQFAPSDNSFRFNFINRDET